MADKRNIGNVKNLGNGKYLLRISCGFDDFGNRLQFSRTVEAKSDRDAEQQLMKFYQEKEKIKEGKTSKAPKTLDELYDEWNENHVKPNLRGSTAVFYQTMRNHIEPFKNTKMSSLSPKTVNKIVNSFEAPRTRKGVFAMLNTMFSHAVKWGYMPDNPCKRIDVPKYKAAEKTTYTDEELSFIMDIISKEPIKFQVFFYFAIVRYEARRNTWA
jgi:hypothetical protein